MSGELEAAGAMATAGLVAGAVEGREPGQAGEGHCRNCGAKIEGRFCASCGQATHANRKLTHLLEEVLHSLFHLDTKLWRTLPMVVFRPGTLTRNYVYGKRARYISPLALFLFSIFLLFFAVSVVDAPVQVQTSPAEQRAALASGLEEARADVEAAERELAATRAAPVDPEDVTGDLDLRLAEQAVQLARDDVERREQAIARIDAAAAQQAASAPAAGETPTATEGQTPATAPAATAPAEANNITVSDGDEWKDMLRDLATSDDFVVIRGMPELNERVRRNFANPDLALYRIQEAASKFSFLLAPLTLPFIMLLFLWKRGVTMYDHIVYALYALSFAAFLFVALLLLGEIAWLRWLPGSMVVFGLPVHTFFHLKGAYALGTWSALWRTFFMLIFATIVLTIYIVLIVILGLAG